MKEEATRQENGWEIIGPYFKGEDHYLNADGDNPEAPWPGYGWPLGSECWYFRLVGYGWSLIATGSTMEQAEARLKVLMEERRA